MRPAPRDTAAVLRTQLQLERITPASFCAALDRDWVDAIFVCDTDVIQCSERLRGKFWGDASWSPEGDRLAVIRSNVECTEVEGETEDGPWLLEVIDAEGGITSLSSSHGFPRAAAWSPQGDVLVVAVKTDAGSALLVWNPGDDQVESRHEVSFAVEAVAWSADGDRWIVQGGFEPPRIAVLDAATAEVIAEFPGYDQLVTAPDGGRALARDAASYEPVLLDLETGATRPALGSGHRWRTRCD